MENRFGNKIIYQLAPRTFTPQGTLKAARKLLPHLKETGFDVVYLTPIFLADDDTDRSFWSARLKKSGAENPKNPYRMKDYYEIDEEYGTKEDLKAFVAAAHSLGLSVLLDLVYFHCGPKAAFLEEHPDFVRRNEAGGFALGEWGYPVLNFDNPALREYLWKNMEYFVREFGVDGYRCDVGQLVPDDFWVEGIRRIHRINPDILMLNEGYVVDLTAGESENGVFDANYNFSWCNRLIEAMDGRADAEALRAQWFKDRDYYRGLTGKCARMIDSHDLATDLPVRNELAWGSRGVECALVINHTIDGVPFVFNGYEVASTCAACMFASRLSKGENAIEWSNLLLPEGKYRLAWMKRLNELHHQQEPIWKGSLRFPETTREKELFAFVREYEGKRLLTVANVSSQPVCAEVSIESAGMKELLAAGAAYRQEGPALCLTIGPKGYLVLAD